MKSLFFSIKVLVFLCVSASLRLNSSAQSFRRDISLNENWLTIAAGKDSILPSYSAPNINDKTWKRVDIPHNWDAYHGYLRLLHGNMHGDSWYRKTFQIKESNKQKRFFLFFEGVGSYATVYVNGKLAGEHAGGRTSFTIDITHLIKTDGSNNQLSVRAYHPSGIQDLPWVCGGCSEERGFSEGSQPMGIFRPVHLIVTNDVRIAPFGIHAWADINNGVAWLNIHASVKNYSDRKRSIRIRHQLIDAIGNHVTEIVSETAMNSSDSLTLSAKRRIDISPYLTLWSPANPYLYKIVSRVEENGKVIDTASVDFGFRTINWKTSTHQFVINDQPVFINGVAEYEHLLGQSHAFSKEQIISRMKWLRQAGFNAFRDGHQPHNLLYGQLCNQYGILWWTQISAHVWYDTPEFRDNFKKLLREWVIERRNDPAVVLWGLQNESKLPEDFARECTELIRSLDPTTSSQRLVTTCNGGSGTDWDVPQNWTGTYGGDPATYAQDVKKQVLIGEYGAWRTLDLHTEGGFVQNGILSEDRMTQLMEQKVRLAESVKDSSAGQFFWLLTSHDNPGRVQGGEGLRELDRIGPVNYKGLLTPWEEPADVYYMFRSNYASKEKEPMVYIASHTWPSRWMKPGIKDSIYVYSNCDEVELFNDVDNISLGKRRKNGTGTHFQWDDVNIQYNVLFAVGYVNGKAVARDTIVLHHLPLSPGFEKLYANASSLTKEQPGYNYIYRINCGGPEYIDQYGKFWAADRSLQKPQTQYWFNSEPYGSVSWANDFADVPLLFASQRRTFSPVKGTKDWKLFQDFRYGKDKLQYGFIVDDGEYLVELYFIEPWIGIGGGVDGKGMRLFDVAVNGKTVLRDIDIWKEAGTNKAFKKTVKVKVTGGKMIISFPRSNTGQAIISAIAIASAKKGKDMSSRLIKPGKLHIGYEIMSWLDIGNKQYLEDSIRFYSLPPNLYGANWISFKDKKGMRETGVPLDTDSYVFVACVKGSDKPAAISEFENTGTEMITDENGGTYYTVYRKQFAKDKAPWLYLPSTCIVMMQPVTNMQPAYDLKPVTQYRANVVSVSEGVSREMVNGRECASIKANAAVTISYPIQTGVADIYSITMKYYYAAEKTIKGKIQLIGAGNTMMMEEEVSFTFTRPGKWNQFTINTGSMINAGNYIVKLVIENAEGLAISSVDIQ